MPVSALLYVGKNTTEKLKKMGIKTIGDLATCNKYRIVKHLGKLGEQIYNYANGLDNDPVKYFYEEEERKSISKGVTFEEDIDQSVILESEFLKLASDVSFSLRKIDMKASVVSIVLKDYNFVSTSRQKKIEYTNSYDLISKAVVELFNENYTEGVKIRYICVGLTGFKSENDSSQIDFFSIIKENQEKIEKEKKVEKVTKAMDALKEKYGDKINYASTIKNKQI